MRLLLALLLLATLLATPPPVRAWAEGEVVRTAPNDITFTRDDVQIRIVAGDVRAPQRPRASAPVRVTVTAPPGTASAITMRTSGGAPADSPCARPIDPDPMFDGWRICEGVGDWTAALLTPPLDTADVDEPCTTLYGVVLEFVISVEYARLGTVTIQAPVTPAYCIALPLLRSAP